MTQRIAFQGEPGAYSHQACHAARPHLEALPCPTFEAVIEAVTSGAADQAMLPVENTTYGRVADIHRLLPESGLHIVDEAFVRVHINLLGVRGATIADVRDAWSHLVLLPQCARFLREHGIAGRVSPDNAAPHATWPSGGQDAGRARLRTGRRDLRPRRAGPPYRGSRHQHHALPHHVAEPDMTRRADHMMTTFVFRVRNIPAALYKAMGGFATNGVNMTKLESYMVDGSFTATQFYADIEGHPRTAQRATGAGGTGVFHQLRVLKVLPGPTRRTTASRGIEGSWGRIRFHTQLERRSREFRPRPSRGGRRQILRGPRAASALWPAAAPARC
jgi:prephenate dehydratase